MPKYERLSPEELEVYEEFKRKENQKIGAVFLVVVFVFILTKWFLLTRGNIDSILLRYIGVGAYLLFFYFFLKNIYRWYSDVNYRYRANPIKRFFNRFYKNKLAVFGLFVAITIIILAVFAPMLAPYNVDNYQSSWTKFSMIPPTKRHVFGATNAGADLFSLCLYGARIALTFGIGVTAIGVSIGIVLGLIAGYYGGWIDRFLQYLNDVVMAFPFLVLVITVMGALLANPALRESVTQIGNFLNVPGKLFIAFVALSLFGWTGAYRLIRGKVFSVREEEYIDAAKSLGASNRVIMTKHILRNSLTPVIVQASISVGGYIITAASLTFLGLGANPSIPSWGRLLSQGNAYVTQLRYFHLTLFPGLFLTMTVLAFTTLGDGLRDALDPTMRRNDQ
ncbi:ABC transporter permease [archaeon SCG-AAA382B04]|nr:ABC transporter permease [archaeon SCG-AAA382B04]